MAPNGDPPWFERAYTMHSDMIYRVCFSYLKNREDAEDACAEVFLKLLLRGKAFSDAEYEKAWLLRVAINRCKDVLKRSGRKCENIEDHRDLAVEEDGEGQAVQAAILNLPDKYKAVIYLHYYEGYTSKEMSCILKRPQSTVLNHLQEARRYLKGVLADERAEDHQSVESF